MTRLFALRGAAMPLAIVVLTAAATLYAALAEGYAPFVLALVALTVVVGTGLNILVGLTGQISLGHVGFYAIGAYAAAILTLHGVDYWFAFAIAGIFSGLVGFMLALPALRVSGPYLAMITIAFAFIVQHGATEWKELTGGANGLMNLKPPAVGGHVFVERDIAVFSVLLAGVALFFFYRLSRSFWGKGMVAVRDSEIAARSIGLNPVVVKTAAFSLSAMWTGLAGAIFAPLIQFVAPDSFPFSQSILFLLAVIVGGAGWVLGPVIGAVISVVGPELLSNLAEYRLLFFGVLLLIVLWLAPEGVLGTFAHFVRRVDRRSASGRGFDVVEFLRPKEKQETLRVSGIGINFGGISAVTDVSFEAKPGKITSIIGPNGAGKTTVLNIVSGFYRPDAGSVKLGSQELAGASAWQIARAGIARTYQTTKLFGTLSVLDNVLVALRRGGLGGMLAPLDTNPDERAAEALLAFVGYTGALLSLAGDLPHVDRRLVEIARALAMRPRALLLDEPAAGLMRSDKDALSKLLRQIADLGISVILVEHDMMLIMGISDHVEVLDAGICIASGPPSAVRSDPVVISAYLGGEVKARPRALAWNAPADPVLQTLRLTAGYGGAPVLENVGMQISPGETVAIIGVNGAGKSTFMRAVSGLLRPVTGDIILNDENIARREPHVIAASGLALVPEGRQVFPELSVHDNILLGAHCRTNVNYATEIDALLDRFPRLRERRNIRAGLLSGGEQQMLALARALIAKPKVLLLDEPSLGLAPAIINELFDILADLRDQGTTILLVDQMAALALNVADRGYILELRPNRQGRQFSRACQRPRTRIGLPRPCTGCTVIA